MKREKLSLGQKLGETTSIPEYIQVAICLGGFVPFFALWGLDLVPPLVLIPSTIGGVLALFLIAFRIPALRSKLTIYEHGLETLVQGKSAAFTYDELSALAAQFTDHHSHHMYIGTTARIEFFVDGRLTPHVYKCEFRGGKHKRLVALAIDKCSQAIERRLLAELEREGAVRWRDNVSLTPEGLLLSDSASAARLIPYGQISSWKVADNELKIWKADDALPFFVMGNETPNFGPLFGLFQSLCKAIRNVEASPSPATALCVG